MDDENLEQPKKAEDLKKEISEKIAELEEERMRYMENAKRAEGEKRYYENELIRLQKEVRTLKAELERLKQPPMIIGTVNDLLPNGKVIVRSTTGPDFIVDISTGVDRSALKVGSRVSLNKQSLAIMEVLPPSIDPIVSGAEVIEKPSVSYSDIGGLKEELRELREAVEDPLMRPEVYRKVGIEPPKAVLLEGPPGTGKTLMAKAVATQTNATFIRVVGSELVQKYIGEGARLVREMFELAREKSPSIVFIDELDSVGAKRIDMATSGDREVQRTLMQLLSEMDGFNPLGEVKIIGATNRPDILDEALLRPGRFDRIITIPPPDFKARLEIFRIHTRNMNLYRDISLEELASITDGASGADIKAICTEAGMYTIREKRVRVKMVDFRRAVEKVIGGMNYMEKEAGLMFG